MFPLLKQLFFPIILCEVQVVLPPTTDPAMHCVYTGPPSSDQKHDISGNDYYAAFHSANSQNRLMVKTKLPQDTAIFYHIAIHTEAPMWDGVVLYSCDNLLLIIMSSYLNAYMFC